MADERAGRMAGRCCLIVGGTSGIGLATAQRFLGEGARVAIVGLADSALESCRAVLDHSTTSLVVPGDASDPASVAAFFHDALGFLGNRLDVLFHVAGISGRRLGDGPLHDCSDDGFQAVMDANARSVFLTNRAAVRQMLRQERDERGVRGCVLNMGSVMARSPAPRYFATHAYAASKGAVESMTLAAAAYYAPEGIRLNVLAPGLIETPMATRACGDPAIRSYMTAKQPLSAGPGAAADCAEAALSLCEPAARMLTGVVLNVDGGWSVCEGQPPLPHEDPS